ncbi:telomere-protecting terminal protein Tpg [Actinacidiphila glaucinigra]|uniref:telomere-protecting terminal protein Tpg n=1 Tax=Actinacidiphila glaucinigra TaxID=235986 RepID=UPI0035DBB874
MSPVHEASVITALNAVRTQVHDDLLTTARQTLPARLATPHAQVAYVHKRLGATTRATAEALGVHPETVRRWLRGQRKNPPAAFAARLQATVRGLYRPRVTGKQIDAHITTTGLYADVRAQFAFFGANGSRTDDPRERTLGEDLTTDTIAALLAARAAADETRARDLVGAGVAEAYFQLATGLDTDMTDLAFVKFQLP